VPATHCPARQRFCPAKPEEIRNNSITSVLDPDGTLTTVWTVSVSHDCFHFRHSRQWGVFPKEGIPPRARKARSSSSRHPGAHRVRHGMFALSHLGLCSQCQLGCVYVYYRCTTVLRPAGECTHRNLWAHHSWLDSPQARARTIRSAGLQDSPSCAWSVLVSVLQNSCATPF
jgi:hypothetical protein